MRASVMGHLARYTTYKPALIEIISGAGVIAYGLFAFTIGVRFLNVVDHQAKHETAPVAERKPTIIPEAVSTD